MKHVLITGASRGIGHATAKELARRGYRVYATSTSGICHLPEDHITEFRLDLGKEQSILSLAEQFREMQVRLDGVISNAAILPEGRRATRIDMDLLRKTVEVNVFGTIQLTESLIPLLKRGAHILVIGSGWGAFSERHFSAVVPHYKISKAALHMYTKHLAARLGSHGITVSALDPGWVKTDMGTTEAPREPEDAARDIVSLLEADVESGRFWYRGQPRQW